MTLPRRVAHLPLPLTFGHSPPLRILSFFPGDEALAISSHLDGRLPNYAAFDI